jgi:hypothetical protein
MKDEHSRSSKSYLRNMVQLGACTDKLLREAVAEVLDVSNLLDPLCLDLPRPHPFVNSVVLSIISTLISLRTSIRTQSLVLLQVDTRLLSNQSSNIDLDKLLSCSFPVSLQSHSASLSNDQIRLFFRPLLTLHFLLHFSLPHSSPPGSISPPSHFFLSPHSLVFHSSYINSSSLIPLHLHYQSLTRLVLETPP